MKTSKQGIDLIKHYESLHDGDLKKIGLQPKMCPAGIWTEGYGHAMKDFNGKVLRGSENREKAERLSQVKNEDQAEELLAEDLEKFEKIVLNSLKVVIKQHQFDALVSHAFNTGGSKTMFGLINDSSDDDELAKWWTEKYTTAAGVKLRGLVARRFTEWTLYKTGELKFFN